MQNNTATVQNVSLFVDGSGAPSLVRCGGFTFACDMLGEVRVNLVTRTNAWPSKRTVEAVRRAYAAWLATAVGAAWLEANAKMYAESEVA